MAMVPVSSPRREKEAPIECAIDNHLDPEIPLDFSFRNITDCTELTIEDPRSQHKRNGDEKWECHCLRLNNNVLQDLKSLPTTIPKILTDSVDGLIWLDLSFNELPKIDPILCDLPSLRILYLHGNSINAIEEVEKLRGMPNLRKLTLHGNPIASVPNYRWYVLTILPDLRSFDFSTLTKAERRTAYDWSRNNPMKKKKKKSSGE